MRISVDAVVDLDDIVRDYKEEIIEELETCYNKYVFSYKTLNDDFKLKWFKEAMDKYSLEEFEERFPV